MTAGHMMIVRATRTEQVLSYLLFPVSEPQVASINASPHPFHPKSCIFSLADAVPFLVPLSPLKEYLRRENTFVPAELKN